MKEQQINAPQSDDVEYEIGMLRAPNRKTLEDLSDLMGWDKSKIREVVK